MSTPQLTIDETLAAMDARMYLNSATEYLAGYYNALETVAQKPDWSYQMNSIVGDIDKYIATYLQRFGPDEYGARVFADAALCETLGSVWETFIDGTAEGLYDLRIALRNCNDFAAKAIRVPAA